MPNITSKTAYLSVDLHLPNGGYFCLFHLALIDSIRTEGTIIGASRALVVSYRKCWLTVYEMNRTFANAVVLTFPGRRTNGAEITPFGERLAALYRLIDRSSGANAKRAVEELTPCLDWSYNAEDTDLTGQRQTA